MYSKTADLNTIKASFSDVYNNETPHAYYTAMGNLDYQIPENAKPTINYFISQISKRTDRVVNILDLGCSYGVLSALIKHDLPLYLLYRRYENAETDEASFNADRTWLAGLPDRRNVRFYGIDASKNAVSYSKRVGLLEDGVATNLEVPQFDASAIAALPRRFDMVITTGCVGYITDVTFAKVLEHIKGHSTPVFISFVLRAFDYSDISAMLLQAGYETYRLKDHTFKQRRFRDIKEQQSIISLVKRRTSSDRQLSLPELYGYCHAELFVSIHRSADPALVSEFR